MGRDAVRRFAYTTIRLVVAHERLLLFRAIVALGDDLTS
jgi:hypothetical protein